MPDKPDLKPDDPEQSKRFLYIAKETGADEESEALERAFKKITKASLVKPKALKK
jgi:hypothetical protein